MLFPAFLAGLAVEQPRAPACPLTLPLVLPLTLSLTLPLVRPQLPQVGAGVEGSGELLLEIGGG